MRTPSRILVALSVIVALPAVLQTQAISQGTVPAAPEVEAEPLVTVGASGLEVRSADRRYGVRLFGSAQAGARFYLDDSEELGDDTFLVRRARPNLLLRAPAGTSLRIQLEVASGASVLDAYLDWKPFDAFSLRVGRFKVPFGLELLQAATALDFLERGLPSALVPGRDNGIMAYGTIADGLLTYQLGVFNGAPDGGNSLGVDLSDHKDLAARLFLMPFAGSDSSALSGLGLGAAVTWGQDDRGSLGGLGGLGDLGGLSIYRSAGRRPFFSYVGSVADGTRLRLTGQLSYYVGGFHLIGEYVHNAIEVAAVDERAELTHAAWQAAAAYAFGGDAAPAGVTPHANFSLDDGGLGALEIKARVSQARFDSDAFPNFADPNSSAETATEIAAGLNWWWSRNVRWMVDYYFTQFDAPAGGTDLQDEMALIVSFQLGL